MRFFLHLLSSIPRKTSSGPDGISSAILRNTATAFAPSLTKLINRSQSLGQVPADWKLSNITLVPKGGDSKLVSNYCPILLSLPSKILERIIYNRLLSPLLTNSLLSNSQFGFRPCSSAQEALIAVTTSWHQYLDEKQSVAAVFFDRSKAFDLVPHSGILRALTRIGVTGSLHTWFADYRTQRVVLNGHSSQVTKVSSGIQQGSILGPLLFSIYIDQLCSIPLSTTFKIQLYADDILLHKPIGRDCTSDIANLQRDIDSVTAWVKLSGVHLNTRKTKFLLVSRLRHPPPIELKSRWYHHLQSSLSDLLGSFYFQ